ncbi:MAG: sulfatase [bacterium]|nr:sulfatase [bacterium]
MGKTYTQIALLITLLISGCGVEQDTIFNDDLPKRVIVISLDCLRADRLHCYGNDRQVSATLDSLAAVGTRFSEATAPSNWTLPSHVSLFTGINQLRHRVEDKTHTLSPRIPHMVENIRAAGFETAAFTGGGYLKAMYGHDRGFNHYESGKHLNRNWTGTLQETKKWLADHTEEDFFLFVHTYEIHAPYNPPREWIKRVIPVQKTSFGGTTSHMLNIKKRGVTTDEIEEVTAYYDAGILYTDEMLAGFTEWLRDQGLDENLLLIVSSDHGEQFWEHGEHGHGDNKLGRELTDVPLIVNLPHGLGLPETTPFVSDANASFIDIMPTVLEALEVQYPANLDGYSLMHELVGREISDVDMPARIRRTQVIDGTRYQMSITSGANYVALICGDKKFLLQRPDRQEVEVENWPCMYDLAADPMELNPLPIPDELIESLREVVKNLATDDKNLSPGKQEIDPETRRQLEALGYL